MNAAPVIGLTGGIGAGKSTVAGMLRDLGCVVADADEAVADLLEDPTILQELASWWGPSVLASKGGADHAAVARIVFEDPDQRRRLEALLHPRVDAMRRASFDAAPQGTPALVIDAPLLLEVDLDRACDAVWFIVATPAQRLRRLQQERGWDAATLDRREECQLSLDEKCRRSHDVIENNGNAIGLRERVQECLEAVCRRFQESRSEP